MNKVTILTRNGLAIKAVLIEEGAVEYNIPAIAYAQGRLVSLRKASDTEYIEEANVDIADAISKLKTIIRD